MTKSNAFIGTPRDRVDGAAKVTGAARYAAEFNVPDLLYGYIVSSAIAKGRILSMTLDAASAVPGVFKIITHENRPRTAWFSYNYQDGVGPPGKPFRPLYDEQIVYSGQPIALVLADDFSVARHAASLIQVTYDVEDHQTDLEIARENAYVPPKERSGISPPPKPRGDARRAFADAPVRIEHEYRIAREHHNPMEPHAATVFWNGDGKIVVYDKTQGVQNAQAYVTSVFGLAKTDVEVVSPFVGGAFGSGLRPQYHLFLAVMAALDTKRSVRVEMTRSQMFSHVHRPETINRLALGATNDGAIQSIIHEATQGTSTFEDHQEVVVNWSSLLYHSDNIAPTYKIAKLDTYTPGDARAPGAPLGVFAIESAIDELAYETTQDPIALRLKNYTERDENEDKPYTSKELRACFEQGARKFGWDKRSREPRSMREGREFVGYGVASGVWEAMMQKTSARATLKADGTLEVASATADIGTGTYTILTQIAADTLGLTMGDVVVQIGHSSLPESPVEGGSWTAASAGSAVQAACMSLQGLLLKAARKLTNSPLANADLEQVVFQDGRIAMKSDPARSIALTEVLRGNGLDRLVAEETAQPDAQKQKMFASYTHAAVFAEVRVDEELGIIRVTRIVTAVAAGNIINPKTARSQVIGGVVWGLGMALHEETLTDHKLGRFMNHNLAEYHVPANADVHDIEVIFVDENDESNKLGVKGLGEIGIVGTAAAIANAVYHATGRRQRSLPITVDKLLAAGF